MATRFLHYGCWNNGKCGEENVPQTNVSNSVIAYIEQHKTTNPAEFLLIAGDNYYPEKNKDKTKDKDKDKKDKTKDKYNNGDKKDKKQKKEKTIVPDNLISGFECLEKIPIKKYILLGNHDIENIKDRCEIIDQQLVQIQNTENMYDENRPIIVKHFIIPHKNTQTLFILFDTTVFTDDIIINDDEEDKENIDLLECYKHIPELNYVNSFDDIRKHIQSYINGLLIKNTHNININDIKNVITVGHHPIVHYKMKNENKKNEHNKKLSKFIYENIFVPLSQPTPPNERKYYHLCADTHHFQSGVITLNMESKGDMVINQFISGTGGATLDPIIPISAISNKAETIYKTDDNTTYATYLMKNSVYSHGFCDCVLSGDGDLDVQFIPAETAETTQQQQSILLPPAPPTPALSPLLPPPPATQTGGKKIKKNKRTTLKRTNKNKKRRQTKRRGRVGRVLIR